MEMISKAIVDGSMQHLMEGGREDKSRAKEIQQEFGKAAQHVDPYKPNRKQLRAQKAAKRKQKAKSRSR